LIIDAVNAGKFYVPPLPANLGAPLLSAERSAVRIPMISSVGLPVREQRFRTNLY